MQERKYQEDWNDSIISELSVKRKVQGQLPTGGGKTVCFAKIAQRYIRAYDQSVLILVHRIELLEQSRKTIKAIMGIEPYIINAQTKKFAFSRVYIGMVESCMSRLNLLHNVGLVIVDEDHIANFNKIHNTFLDQLIIGVSATPISSSKKEPLNKYYQSIVVGPQINELIKLKHLVQNITRCPKNVVDSTQFKIDKLKGDFNEGEMAMEYKQPKHVMNLVKYYNLHCHSQKTIIFNVNKEHSKEVNEMLFHCGFNSRHLDSDCTLEERADILKWFKETPDAILNNVMIATVGFDEPSIRNVILNFSTLSLVKFIQCSGRGGRPYPGKEYFNIIDMGGNCIRFGDWNDDRDWEFIFHNPAKANEGIAPKKTCPQCEGLVHASIQRCPLKMADGSDCDYEFVKVEVKEQADLGELILRTKGVNIEELIGKNRNKFEYYTFFELGSEVVQYMYTENPNPSESTILKYFNVYYELCKEWYSKELAGKNGNIMDITDSAFHIRMAKNNFEGLIASFFGKKFELDIELPQQAKIVEMKNKLSREEWREKVFKKTI